MNSSFTPVITIASIDEAKNILNLCIVKTPVQSLESKSDYFKAKAILDNAMKNYRANEKKKTTNN